jgi:hypothetical protein
VAGDSSQSRAVFRVAATEESPRAALALYRQYATLEPDDPWGHMAVGDVLSRLGATREAMAAYDVAVRLAPAERDVAIGRARVLSRGGRPEAAAGALARWVELHGTDAEAWELLARERLRSGRPRLAAAAAARADSLRGRSEASSIRRSARLQDAAFVEPIAGYQRDSDGNHTRRLGATADVAVADGVRLAGQFQRGTAGDDVVSMDLAEGGGRLVLRARSDMQLRLDGGLTRLTGPTVGVWATPYGELRFRRRAGHGPTVDLRAQRTPLVVSPLLAANRVARIEARGSVEVPIAALRIRPGGRIGAIESKSEPSNQRTGVDLAVAIPLGWQGEISGQYHRLSYRASSAAGYFAPRLVETREVGGYLERESDAGLALAVDAGAGVQRVAEHGAGLGTWERALRGWASLTIPVGPTVALWMETEAYDAPFAPEGVTTSESWRFLAVSIGLRWRLSGVR